MCLEEFSNKVEKALMEYYGEEAQVRCQKVHKNNGVLLYGICVMKKGKNIAPTIYLNDFYELYEDGTTFGEVINDIIQMAEYYQVPHNINVDFFTDYNEIKQNLVLRLIHFEENIELLKEVPHRRFMDLAVVCHCIVESEEIGSGAILIRREHMESWKIDEDTMFDDAFLNSPRKEPYRFMKMSDMLIELLAKVIIRRAHDLCEGDEEEELDMVREVMERIEADIEERHLPMYVLTNQKRYMGASCILYPRILEKIGNLLQEDYYVIPSSIHEVLIIRESESMESIDINRMIKEVNQTQVEQVEWLSNHTYFYNRDGKKLFPVTNS